LGAAAQRIRTEVFVHEQGVPLALEWDEVDETAACRFALNIFQ
jgi:predicted GNAT family N-acyltransferase